MDDRCPDCGALYALVGRRHACRPRPELTRGIAEGREAAPGLPVANEDRGPKGRGGTLERSLDRGDANPKGGAVALDTRQPAVGVESDPRGQKERAPRGSFDRKAYQRELMRKRRRRASKRTRVAKEQDRVIPKEG